MGSFPNYMTGNKHISYDISNKNEERIQKIYSMMKQLDSQNQKIKYFKAQKEPM